MTGTTPPPPRRRAWPPLPAVLGGAAALAVVIALFKLGRATPPEPEPVARAWPSDPAATASVEAFLDRSAAAPPRDFVEGIALGLFSKEVRYDYGHLIDEIADHEAGWISLFYNMFQEDAQAVTIAPATRLIDQERMLERAARQAHARGLKVLSFPIVLLEDDNSDDWRGNLRPRSLDRWFENYGDHILRLARLSERLGIEALTIGSEFSSLEGEQGRWRNLIAQVREVYGGELIYSANWDHYDLVPFWDAVDYIGLSGYYELTNSTEPELEDLVAEWTRVRDRIEAWRAEAGLTQPLLFTEIGYPNQDGANIHPWDYTGSAQPDPAEQALCYESFIRVWHGRPGFAGVFFYNWFGFDTLEDTGYSPRGKPAAQVIRAWYGRIEP